MVAVFPDKEQWLENKTRLFWIIVPNDGGNRAAHPIWHRISSSDCRCVRVRYHPQLSYDVREQVRPSRLRLAPDRAQLHPGLVPARPARRHSVRPTLRVPSRHGRRPPASPPTPRPTRKASSIEDRRPTDRASCRHANPNVALIFSPTRAMCMTHTRARGQGYRGNRRTDGRTDGGDFITSRGNAVGNKT